MVDDGSTDAHRDRRDRRRRDGARTRLRRPPAGSANRGPATPDGRRREGERLLFLDADTWLAPDGVARLASAHAAVAPDGLLSVQPFHEVRRPYEQLSAWATWSPIMASGAASIASDGSSPRRLRALPAHRGGRPRRRRWLRRGARRDRRGRRPRRRLPARRQRPVRCLGGGTTVRFRMYPDGVRSLVQGWTKNLAGGALAHRADPDRRRRAVGDGGGGDHRRRGHCPGGGRPGSPPLPSPSSCAGCSGGSVRSTWSPRCSSRSRWWPSSSCSCARLACVSRIGR